MDTQTRFTQVCGLVARTFAAERDGLTGQSGVGTVEGWDSLGHLRLMMAVEAAFAVRFRTEELSKPRTIDDLCSLLETKGL